MSKRIFMNKDKRVKTYKILKTNSIGYQWNLKQEGDVVMIKSKLLWKVIGLEILVIFWFVVNGAYVSMTHPTKHYLQFLGIFHLAIGIAFYKKKKKKWSHFSSLNKTCRLERESCFFLRFFCTCLLSSLATKVHTEVPLLILFLFCLPKL